MRVLLTSLTVPSHLWTMVAPTARLLQSAGHDVAIATGKAFADEVARVGVPVLPLERMLDHAQLAAEPELARQAGYGGSGNLADQPDASHGSKLGQFVAGVLAERAAEELLDATATWQPDLVVREALEFAGVLVAEGRGIPVVTLDNAPLEVTRDAGILPWLNRSRSALGLPPTGSLSSLIDSPWVSWLGPAWRPSDPPPTDYRHYRAPMDDHDDHLDAATAAVAGERPLVLAAFGSLVRQTVGIEGTPLTRVVAALGTLPCTAVVALGDDAAVASWSGPRPANVHLTGFLAQRALLPACDLFITHAGFGSLREALTAGVPMVALPLHSEQPANAQRLAELELGITLDPMKVTVEEIAQACRTVLTEPGYRERAQRWQRRTLDMPDSTAMVRDLEDLAGAR
jgi:UDP:flavonoid glycosyltransferase YjiC (YdhE family)